MSKLPPIKISRMIVEAELQAELPNAFVQVSDSDYQIMADKVFTGWAWRMFTWLLTIFRIPRREDNTDLPKWMDKFQCEDISVVYIAIILLIHARAKIATGEGVYAGLVFHRARSGEGHVVLFKRNAKQITYFEPQTRQFYQFTQEEKDSSWLAITF